MPVFDAGDVGYFLEHFGVAELRKEARSCDVQVSVCHAFGEDDWAFIYTDLAEAMRLALDILQSRQPKPAPRPGKETIDIQAVKSRNDIVTVAERYTQLRKSGARFSGKCPLHESKGSPLTIYPENQSWFCFHCDRGGDVLDMVMAFERLEFQAAVQTLK